MIDNSSNQKKSSSQSKNGENKRPLKAWKAPKLQVESTNNTLGGTTNTNAPGDDTWYVS